MSESRWGQGAWNPLENNEFVFLHKQEKWFVSLPRGAWDGPLYISRVSGCKFQKKKKNKVYSFSPTIVLSSQAV